ncbi:ELWxxDGT repeat protein [Emticicia sp. C21]|uniref:ELWxxDGT repeat protein n=1 Tax=Emticicia sp. C21 TaxID=2302915 RepID=UPI000E342F40|nr:ELWxxDGT repeat protein [Emticicia sp. C21]RFS17783.1 hypothetical protein D0T08_00600 [Emticicia sp. C21]
MTQTFTFKNTVFFSICCLISTLSLAQSSISSRQNKPLKKVVRTESKQLRNPILRHETESKNRKENSVAIPSLTDPTNVWVDATLIDSGSSVNLAATCAEGTVTWYNQASAGSAIGTGSPLTVAPTSTTTYYAACESESMTSNRVATEEVRVRIVLGNPTGVAVSLTDVCVGENVLLSASCEVGTVKWYNAAEHGLLIGTGSPLLVTVSSTSRYYAACEREVDLSAREPTNEVTVRIIPDPTAVSVDKISICAGASVTLAATCSSGSLRWYTDLNGTTSIGSASLLTHIPVSDITYYAACLSDGCLSNKVNAGRVVINAIPGNPTGIIADNTTIVNGRVVTLNATCATGILRWYNQATDGMLIGEASPFKYYPANTTTFYASCRNGACESSRLATSEVTVSALNQLPYMVKNISAGANSSSPYNFVKLNDKLYFFANDGENGVELWESNGTDGGTKIVKNINPNSNSNPEELIVVNNTLYFVTDDGVHGTELWRSDGTDSGTVLVEDINPSGDGQISNLTNINGNLYFSAFDGTTMGGLWKVDGITGETSKVTEKVSNASTFVNVNGTLLFQAFNSGGIDLWKSDGTDDGTVRLKTGSAFPMSGFLNINGTIYFAAGDYTNGKELWKTDGTADGAELVADIAPDIASSNPSNLIDLNGTLYFIADAGMYGYELWKSDGTAGGTTVIKDINDNSVNSIINNVFNLNGTLYFAANDGVNGYELWKSNGTIAELVKDINPTGNSVPGVFTELNGAFYFIADDGVHGKELWKSDGTEGGTSMVKDINISGDANIMSLTNFDGVLYFQAENGTNGKELWKSDGTESGTVPISDIDNQDNFEGLTKINGIVYFGANTNSTGSELWKTNGTLAGTSLVKDIHSGDGTASLGSMTNVNGTLYFTSNSGELWKTDGTDAGTSMLQSIDLISSGGGSINSLTNVNGLLYFTAPGAFSSFNLWKSDGSLGGTMSIFESKGSNMSFMNNLTSMGGNLYFKGYDGIGRSELWKSDGTEQGTIIVKYINPSGNSLPDNLLNVGEVLYFAANDGTNGTELWRSNGTEEGTVMVKDINPSGSSSPSNLVNVNGTLYFTAYDETHGIELWKSDGTPNGTVLVKNINTSSSSSPSNLVNVNGTLYFTANDGDIGIELWKSDGSDIGTVRVKDVNPVGDSSPNYLTNVNGVLYFTANDGTNGIELWKSDGSDDGTVLVKDINVLENSSSPTNLVNVNGTLYFTADDGVNGVRLWKSDSNGIAMVDNATHITDVNNLLNVGGKLYFIASITLDGFKYGNELWSLGSCTTDNDVVTEYGKTNKFNSAKHTTPSLTTCHCDVFNKLITAIDSTGLSPVSNPVNVKEWIENTAIEGFVRRHFEMRPANNPSIATGKVTLYFTQADFDAYNTSSNSNVLKLPAGGDDTESMAYIIIQKFGGVSDDETGLPSTYTSDPLDINPDMADIVWDSTANRWEISFTTRGFGGYFLKTEVLAKPTGVSVNLTSICRGTNVSLSATCAKGIIAWYNQTTGGTAIGTGSPLSVIPDTTTTYYATCQVGETNSERVATSEITVKAIPDNPTLVSVNKTDICVGESVSLTATCATGTIRWYAQASGSTPIGTVSSLIQTPASTITYYAACISNDCESNRVATSQVVVHAIPVNPTTVTLGNTAICSGTAVSLTATCITGTITWYNQATGGIAIGTGNGLSQSPIVNTNYYASCKSSFCESGRVLINQVTVTIQPTNPTSVSVSKTSICNGTSVSLAATCSIGTVTWYSQLSGGSSIGTGTGLSKTPTVNTTYYASCKNGNCESARVATSTVGVWAQVTDPTSVSVTNDTICQGSSILLTATCATGTLTWYNQATGGTALGTGSSLSQTPAISTTFYASCINGACISNRVATGVVVTTLPMTPIISGTNEICAGETVLLTASTLLPDVDGVSTYHWTGGLTGNSISVSPTTSKSYRAIASLNGCYSDSSEVFTIMVNIVPVAPDITTDNSTICSGDIAIITAQCASQSEAFYWSVAQARTNDEINPAYINVRTITAPGTYKGYCLSSAGCRGPEASITITQDSNCGGQKFITITPEKPVICPGTSVKLSASGCSGTVTWTGGPTVLTGTSATFNPTTSTTYLIQCSTGGNANITVAVAETNTIVTRNVSTGESTVKAVNKIESAKKVGDINYTPGPRVSFEAGNSILLKPGFAAEKSAVFTAQIKACN